jgi:hypothetical protein
MATEPCDDPAAYANIPTEFFDCILPRRHMFPLSRLQKQYVRIALGPSKRDGVLELTEYYGTCPQCGTTRTLQRDRYTREYVSAVYVYPDGYLAPKGTKWDPDLLWAEYFRRSPITGAAVKRKR